MVSEKQESRGLILVFFEFIYRGVRAWVDWTGCVGGVFDQVY